MSDRKSSFILYADAYECMRSLAPAQKGELLDAIYQYQLGEPISFTDQAVQIAFSFIKAQFQRDDAKYLKKCEKARKAAKMRWDANACERISEDARNADTDTDTDTDTDINNPPISPPQGDTPQKQKRTRFTPPTVEEVEAYCLERGNKVSPEQFVDYYASKGWSVGRSKMKDWKASVRTWERNEFNRDSTLQKRPDPFAGAI